MIIPRLRMAALAGLAMIASSCVRETQAPRDAGGEDAIRARLEALADAHFGEQLHWTWEADSTASAVVPGLKYHWILVAGDRTHDGGYFTVVRAGGRRFDAEDLAGWGPLFGTWQPRHAGEALSFCAEAVAVSVLGRLHHIRDSTSPTLDAEWPRVAAHHRELLARARNATVVAPPSADRPAWDVRYWYLDGFPTRGSRMATRYRCRIPTTPRPLEIEIVDSINPTFHLRPESLRR
jgi:hypothetical protein